METDNLTQTFTRSYTLPSISLGGASKKYCQVPRRYEETRPVAVQDFSHKRILGIGNDLLNRSLQTFDSQKQDAIRKAEEAVWYQAEHIKNRALIDTKEAANLEHEKAIKKLKKVHEKNIKEEALRVELAMQKLSIEQVQLARHEADVKQMSAIVETERKGHEHLIKMVQIARDEEIEEAADNMKRIKKEHAAALKKQEENLLQQKEKEVTTMCDRKDKERKESVEAVIQRERDIAEAEQQRLIADHSKQLNDLKQEFAEKNAEMQVLMKDMKKLEKQKANIYDSLVHTRHEFQKYITQTNAFDKEQTDCLIPPLYMDELEKI